MPLFMLVLALVTGLELMARMLPPVRRGLPRLVMAGVVGGYLGALLAVSLSSRETVLPSGEVKRFCGFYFDCHLGVAVIGVRRGATFPGGPAAATNGTLYLVTLEARNDARRATLALHHPQVLVVDDAGRRYPPLGGKTATAALAEPIPPGFSIATALAFDLPADVRHPRLLVIEGGWTDRLLERFLIGDDDSLLHAPTTLSLAGP